jgi:hypothetical protein
MDVLAGAEEDGEDDKHPERGNFGLASARR